MKIISDIRYKDAIKDYGLLDIYLPDADEFPVFIYFHGGGLEKGNKSEADLYARFLADKGIATVTANYRMYPDAKYPDFIEDAALAVNWAYKNMPSYGKCTKFFIGGTSAGAFLSMMLCFDKKYLAPYGIDPENVDGFIHNAGQPTAHFNVLRERGIDTRRVICDETSALYHIGLYENYPPMLFFVADNDMECRYEQTMLTIATLKHFGCSEDKITLRVLEGKHCNYVFKEPIDGKSEYGDAMAEFILG